jgi:hypothetical protein
VSTTAPPPQGIPMRLSPAEVRAAVAARPRQQQWVPKVRVFVGSPGDVPAERAAVRAVAERVERKLGGAVDVDVFLWEEHATPHWDRTQAVVFRNTRFETMDLFVFIFRSRLGTPTGADDPLTGEEFGSGTLEELEEARRLCAGETRKRVMIYFCARDFQPADDAQRAQWGKLRAFRDGLDTGPGRGLYGTYPDAAGFGDVLFDHLFDAVRDFVPAGDEAPPRTYDPFVAKLCDRIHHDRQFGDFFREGLQRHPGVAQAAVIWGDPDQAHDSFIDRIRKTRVQALADGWKKWKAKGSEEKAIVLPPRSVEWPDEEAGGDLRRQLSQGLVEAFCPGYFDLDYSAAALARLHELRGYDVVAIQHDLHVRQWGKAAAELLEWYVDEYWTALPPFADDRPQFLVLFKIVYHDLSESSRKRLKTTLNSLRTPGRPGCRRILLPELEPITREHVDGWLREHAADLPDERVKKLRADLFGAGAEERAMTDVEEHLKQLLNELEHRAFAGRAP